MTSFVATAKVTDERSLIETWVHRWGGSISEAIIESPCQYFRLPALDGFIGYRIISNCAVVLGEPVCAEESKYILAKAFQSFCDEHKLSYIYFIVSEQFALWAIENICKIMIGVGEETIFYPAFDATVGPKANKLRNYIRHAKSFGLAFKEYTAKDAKIEQSILQVGKKWLKGRKGPQIYLAHLDFFETRNDKRWFYVEDSKQQIIAMALLSRLESVNGWLLKFLIAVPEAPRGTSELLMISILETLRAEDCPYLTFGMVPGNQLGKIVGIGKFSAWVARTIYAISKFMFKLNQRKIYWQKYQPHLQPSFLLFSNNKVSYRELIALMNTLKIDLKT